MDLTNLRESLETPAHNAPSRVHDEQLTNEFRVAALQLTNLYKQGLKSTQTAFLEGYTKALGDALECVRSAAQGPCEQPAQMRLNGLCDYMERRLDALHTEVQEQEEAHADATARAASQPAAPPSAASPLSGSGSLRARRSNERRPEHMRTRVMHHIPDTKRSTRAVSTPSTPAVPEAFTLPHSVSELEMDTATSVHEHAHVHPCKRRRAFRRAEHGASRP